MTIHKSAADKASAFARRKSGALASLIQTKPRASVIRFAASRIPNPLRFDRGEMSLLMGVDIIVICRTSDLPRYITAMPAPKEDALLQVAASRDALMQAAAVLLGLATEEAGKMESADLAMSDPSKLDNSDVPTGAPASTEPAADPALADVAAIDAMAEEERKRQDMEAEAARAALTAEGGEK